MLQNKGYNASTPTRSHQHKTETLLGIKVIRLKLILLFLICNSLFAFASTADTIMVISNSMLNPLHKIKLDESNTFR